MEDILSGGTIDPSTDGPLPQNIDGRRQDIISEQRSRQEQDSIGGTEFAPRPQPFPQIPQAEEISPPLTNVQSFNFDVVSSAAEDAREIARQAAIDVFKNVTINGKGPTIDGSSISFDVEKTPSASEAFSFNLSDVNPPKLTSDFSPAEFQTQIADVKSFTLEAPSAPTITAPEPPAPERFEMPQPSMDRAPEIQDGQRSRAQQITESSTQDQFKTPEPPRSKADESKEPTMAEVRERAEQEGGQTRQRSWSNFIDPQTVKDALIEERNKIQKGEDTKESPIANPDLDNASDYSYKNTPFPPLVEFTVCINGSPKKALIPAFVG